MQHGHSCGAEFEFSNEIKTTQGPCKPHFSVANKPINRSTRFGVRFQKSNFSKEASYKLFSSKISFFLRHRADEALHFIFYFFTLIFQLL